jgi:hypothetical protein
LPCPCFSWIFEQKKRGKSKWFPNSKRKFSSKPLEKLRFSYWLKKNAEKNLRKKPTSGRPAVDQW